MQLDKKYVLNKDQLEFKDDLVKIIKNLAAVEKNLQTTLCMYCTVLYKRDTCTLHYSAHSGPIVSAMHCAMRNAQCTMHSTDNALIPLLNLLQPSTVDVEPRECDEGPGRKSSKARLGWDTVHSCVGKYSKYTNKCNFKSRGELNI